MGVGVDVGVGAGRVAGAGAGEVVGAGAGAGEVVGMAADTRVQDLCHRLAVMLRLGEDAVVVADEVVVEGEGEDHQAHEHAQCHRQKAVIDHALQ